MQVEILFNGTADSMRRRIIAPLKRGLKKDGSKASLSEFSDFGLLQMTRQRVGLSILHTLTNKCKICNKDTEEIHHIKEQNTADENNFIDYTHKNNLSNLVPFASSNRHGTVSGQCSAVVPSNLDHIVR